MPGNNNNNKDKPGMLEIAPATKTIDCPPSTRKVSALGISREPTTKTTPRIGDDTLSAGTPEQFTVHVVYKENMNKTRRGFSARYFFILFGRGNNRARPTK